jgi:CRP/FNR family transcriptional regulator
MFFVVESGELSIDQHGEEVATLGPGSSFGEIALIDRRPRTATVTAVTDVTAYGLPVFVFRPFVEARPQVAWKMLESMADRLAIAESR